MASDTIEVLDDKVLDAEVDGQDVRFRLLEQPGDGAAGADTDGAAS